MVRCQATWGSSLILFWITGFPGNFNKQFYSAISTDQHLDARTDLVQLQLKAGGTLIDLCSGPLTVAGGLEYRSDFFIQDKTMCSANCA